MILASVGNVAVSCILACTTLTTGVEHVEPVAQPVTESTTQETVWDALAECESHGEWDYGPHSDWGSRLYHGGLQFHPDTWSAYRSPEHPQVAYQATREQQIVVAERVLEAHGWGQWPACSRKLGLR